MPKPYRKEEAEAIFEKYVKDFVYYIASQKRLRPLTVYHYQRDLVLLEHYVKKNPVVITQEDLRAVLVMLRKNALSSKTIARILSTWRQFFIFLLRHQHIQHNPTEALHPPKGPKYLPHWLSVDQMAAFFHSLTMHTQTLVVGTPEHALWLRDVAIAELFYSSGVRLSELAQLNIPNSTFASFSLSDCYLSVQGKGEKYRQVPFGRMAATAIHAWLSVRSLIVDGEEQALFVNHRGRRLSVRGIELRMTALSRFLPCGVHLHPHLFRHSFASHILESSNDLRSVQELLGHASLSSTQIYTHLNFQALSSVYDITHPRARKKTASSCE